MRKLREDATWNSLTKQHRETLETWLFDENLGYKKTVERVKTQFGIQTSITSLCRYYRRRTAERHAGASVLAQMNALEPKNLKASAETLRDAALTTTTINALTLAAAQPQQMDHLLSLTRLLLQNERNKLQRSRLELVERSFIHKAAATMSIDSPRAPLAIFEQCQAHPKYHSQTA